MSIVICHKCKVRNSGNLSACFHCGYLLVDSSNINFEIELIKDQLFKLQEALQQNRNHDSIYNEISNLFDVVHLKIGYKPDSQYDDLLFIMTKHMCYDVNIISHMVVVQYFNLRACLVSLQHREKEV